MTQLPEIKTVEDKLLLGMTTRMSLVNNTTPVLWKSFMMRRKEILNAVSNDLYSIQVYDSIKDLEQFSPKTEFTKWAAIEVEKVDPKIPMTSFILKGGQYAVFNYTGTPADFHEMAQYIYGEWLPNSEYTLDNRPHFEVLGDKYKRNDPASEEEVWIPIKLKS